jgi:hypothetical protein
VSFKSHTPQEIAAAGGSRLTKAGLEELGLSRQGSKDYMEKISQASIAERSLNFMQTRQQTAQGGSRVNSQTKSVADPDMIFQADSDHKP